MHKYIKYILVSLFLFFPVGVIAAHVVPGKIPNVEPLQPMPSGVLPNIQYNVISSSSQDSSRSPKTQSGGSFSEINEGSKNSQAQSQVTPGINSQTIGKLVFSFVALIAGILVILWVWYNNKRR